MIANRKYCIVKVHRYDICIIGKRIFSNAGNLRWNFNNNSSANIFFEFTLDDDKLIVICDSQVFWCVILRKYFDLPIKVYMRSKKRTFSPQFVL